MGCCHIQERCHDKTKSRQEMFGLILVCNNKKSILDMYESAGRQELTFWLREREDMTTTAGRPGLSMCGCFNAQWKEGNDDEVVTDTRVAKLISMRIMKRQWSVYVESARSPYQ